MPGHAAETGASERLDRERQFHDHRFTDEVRQPTDRFYEVDSGNWRYRTLVHELIVPDARVLEYGCGTGSQSFELTDAGASVVGIDVSGVGIAQAAATARATGRQDVRFTQMDAERLAFASSTFDVVCGSAILHHLDLRHALDEVHRVLRRGGSGVFFEPLGTNPLINLYRRRTPDMRTPDEHPLLPADFAQMGERFASVTVEYHNFLALVGVVLRRIPRIGQPLVGLLQRGDRALFDRFPRSRALAWVAVVHIQR
jgi:SAM-dependent methyltransferase